MPSLADPKDLHPGGPHGSPASRTILSLDGGGVRGVIAIAFLERIEELARFERSLAQTDLASLFDLVGGTSTGAIIAGGLALGFSSTELRDFYLRMGPQVFRRSWPRLIGVQSVFDSKRLKQELFGIIGGRTLESPDLRCGLAIVMKRMDTGSAWIVTNNPRSKYWNDPADQSYIGNRHYRLVDLIRASAAAPHFFAPEAISVAKGTPHGLFVDGGVTAHNNPSLALLQLVAVPAYGYGWPLSAHELTILSIGTGSFRNRLKSGRRFTAASLAFRALTGLVSESSTQSLTLMQLLGRSVVPWFLNSEIGDLQGVSLLPAPLFTFLRYDLRLESDWLKAELDYTVSDKQLDRLRSLDDAGAMGLAYELGRAAAEKSVHATHIQHLCTGKRVPLAYDQHAPAPS